MNSIITATATTIDGSNGFQVNNLHAGTTNHRVSSQWYARSDDERFLSLDSLYDYVKGEFDLCRAHNLDVRDIRVVAESDDPETLRLELPRTRDETILAAPTNWSFGQMASLLSVPAGYLRKLPAALAGINLQYALRNFREENVKAYVRTNGASELRAATGPDYGRIYDHEVVSAVQRIAGNGIGDTHWKIPGVFDWSTMHYDPHAPITKQSTTLFASDRDVFMFLVDDTHPIQIGTLPDGRPDLVFRGFYGWNSEVGSKTFGVATFYMRGICENRILWGVEGYQEISLRHSKGAPMRFAGEVGPALESFANRATDKLLTGIKSAREAIVATNDEQAAEFLGKQGFTKPESKAVIDAVLQEEGKPARSIWDFVQGITATARSIPHTDARIDMEKRAGKLLDKVAA